MKSLKIFFLAAVAIVAGLFTACNDAEFEAGPGVDGAQVYFPENTPILYSISDDVSSIAIPVKRLVKDAALTVDILSDTHDSELFTIPASATFAAGQQTAELLITFDRTALEDGKEYPLSFMINSEGNTTPYGNYTLDISIEPWPWMLMTENEGKGKFRDDWFSIGFNGEEPEIEVLVHKHKSKEGLYLIEDMFGWNFLTEFFGQPQDALSTDFTYVPTNITIDCSDPNKVLIGKQFTGISYPDPQYGEISIGTFAPGTLDNGVITFPKEGLAFVVTAGALPANKDGLFRIVLPGSEAVDYSLAAAYGGMKVGADNETVSAVFDFTYGADVTNIHYVLAANELSEAEVATLVAAIADESAENIQKFEEFTVGGKKVSAELTLPGVGNYTIVALPLDKAKKPIAKNASFESFYFPGMGGAVADNDIAASVYKVSEYPDAAANVADCPDYSSFVFEISGTEMKSVKYYINTTYFFDNIEIQGGGLTLQQIVGQYGAEFNAEQMGELTTTGKYWNISINRKTNTSYTLVVEATNNYGKKKLVISEPLTTTIPAYTGDLVIGKYDMTYQASPEDTFKNVFNVLPTKGSTTNFLVQDFAMDDDVQWYAAYDQSASILTLSGVQLGREKDGNLLGKFTELLAADESMGYGIFSYAGEASEGSDPVVLTVDPVTKKVSALQTDVEVPVADFTTGKVVDALALYYTNAVIAPHVETSATTAMWLKSAAPVKIPFRAAPAQINAKKQIGNDFRSAMQGVKKVSAVNSGVRTLKVKAQKCEPLPKQAGRRITNLKGNSNFQVLK